MKLNELKIGENAVIEKVGGEGELRQHFLDMGMIPGVEVTLMKYAPMGDPMELRIHEYELTMRVADGEKIEVSAVCPLKEEKNNKNRRKEILHPGLGEGGKFHDRKSEHPLPEDTKLTFALAGNQNCGKTTLFNQLTGSNQHVGNFPGVTVDRKDGAIRGFENTSVTDLPGIYSLSPYTSEEIVSRQFILEEKPTAIINIVDATNIERNLYLTMQLMELDIPMVLALNMMDEVRNNGGSIMINEMEKALGIPVVAISASRNEGIDELIRHAVHIAKYQEKPKRLDFCDEHDHNGAVHRAIHGIMNLIQDHAEKGHIPLRFAATKVIEGDEQIIQKLHFEQNELDGMEHIIQQMESERGLDRAAAIADMRYSFIDNLSKETVVKTHESKEHERSQKIDRILTGRYTAIPSFILIMGAVFYLTFNVFGLALQDLLKVGINHLTNFVDAGLTQLGVSHVIHSLVIDGVFTGVGSVISFIPIILILFLFLSILEDSGYMARVAFVMDKLLRKIGLSGRSIVPMLIGFGCTVPGVMSSRTLPSERDRRMTILLTPFMSCSAKLPIYGFLANAFFPQQAGFVMILMYVIGILMAILVALIAKNTSFKGEAVPFVMELPNYRMPSCKNVMQLVWEKAKDFLSKAFSIIFIATIVVWFLQNFSMSLNMVTDSSDSILASVAGMISPIFSPMGYGDWRIITALMTGFLAKESVLSTLLVLFGNATAITATISAASAFSLLVFCLLYTPCVAAITSIRRELGIKWAISIVVFQCLIAWITSFGIYWIAQLVI